MSDTDFHVAQGKVSMAVAQLERRCTRLQMERDDALTAAQLAQHKLKEVRDGMVGYTLQAATTAQLIEELSQRHRAAVQDAEPDAAP